MKLEEYYTSLNNFIKQTDDKLLRFAFDIFDLNKDSYIC